MANVNISDLHPTGFDLFSDSENYMTELSETELAVQGGSTVVCVVGFAAASSEACAMFAAFGIGYLLSDSSYSGGFSIPDGNGGVTNVVVVNGQAQSFYS